MKIDASTPPFAVPLQIDMTIKPISEMHFYYGPGQLAFDEHGSPEIAAYWPSGLDPRNGQSNPSGETESSAQGEWTRVSLKIDAHECLLSVNGVLGHSCL